MPTLEWFKKEFDYGYNDGIIEDLSPNKIRVQEKISRSNYKKNLNNIEFNSKKILWIKILQNCNITNVGSIFIGSKI